MQELVKQLNDLKITQTSIDWFEDLPTHIWEQTFEDASLKPVESGLDVDKRRWYETSVSVYQLDGGLLGVRFVSDTFSEQSSVDDMYWTLQFFEMEAVQVISYREKK